MTKGNEEMENYRMALAYISKQSTDPQSRELAETALNAFPNGGQPQSSQVVSIDLMQRIWANLYFNEEDAGNTFQATLNEVVDWLAERGSLPPDTRPLREGDAS